MAFKNQIENDLLLARSLHKELNYNLSLSMNSPGGSSDLNRSRRLSSSCEDTLFPVMADIQTMLDDQISSAINGRRAADGGLDSPPTFTSTMSDTSSRVCRTTTSTTTSTTTTKLTSDVNGRDITNDAVDIDRLHINCASKPVSSEIMVNLHNRKSSLTPVTTSVDSNYGSSVTLTKIKSSLKPVSSDKKVTWSDVKSKSKPIISEIKVTLNNNNSYSKPVYTSSQVTTNNTKSSLKPVFTSSKVISNDTKSSSKLVNSELKVTSNSSSNTVSPETNTTFNNMKNNSNISSNTVEQTNETSRPTPEYKGHQTQVDSRTTISDAYMPIPTYDFGEGIDSSIVLNTMFAFASSTLSNYVTVQSGGLISKPICDTFVNMASTTLQNAIYKSMEENDSDSIMETIANYMNTFYTNYDTTPTPNVFGSDGDISTEDPLEEDVFSRIRNYYRSSHIIENSASSLGQDSQTGNQKTFEDDTSQDRWNGLTLQDLKNIPIYKYKGIQHKDGETCKICMHQLTINKCDVRNLPCNHVYHAKCIDPWLKIQPTCPTCRMNIKRHIRKLI